MSLLGPNKIVGEIYSSGWSHYHETFDNEITLEPLSNPHVLSGVLEVRNNIFPIVYNELLLTQSQMIHYRLVYVPNEGQTTTIILYQPYSKLKFDIRNKSNKVIIHDSVRVQNSERMSRIKITLELDEDSMKRIQKLAAAVYPLQFIK
jgi:hypothetical protein